MQDLDSIISIALADNPLYLDILIAKIDGLSNEKIQEIIFQKYSLTHTVEYISCIWRKKIPKIIAETAKKEYIIWYYTNIEKGNWKKCSKCGQTKLAHNYFFSINNTSKDGFYSICKDCRNSKTKKGE